MCRYGMTIYKSHYACFQCRKTFKRRLEKDIYDGYNKYREQNPAKCPECGDLMANMGLDFESPKKKDIKSWEHMATLYEVGITFHSCGCSGPGYIPSNSNDLLRYFSKIKADYIEHQRFWARRKSDPESQSEIAKDRHYNWEYFQKIPNEMKTGTDKKPKFNATEAQKYWHQKIVEIESKIEKVTNDTLKN
ncbi:hypothetical protein SAMN04487765_0197 [Tenacibaculum sp. MAR_2010_89]|uniref:hypothetical protein n=1 Tax=Tenacibaculum sp. MAR_2010_89 TaxID=1250198 RepID=UPI000898B3B1|nr:hypothetical protein [Tenacibaculum sp. MAR_2010_89]SED50636.1 hypothetical protein SAMN04487765_0197 [Tenacibaculum sp. MAR_2010_89]